MRVPMVRREQKVVQPFAKDDLTTLLAACNPKTYVGSRMRAMILFLLDTGVRSSELVSIELCDVLFDEGPCARPSRQGTEAALDGDKRSSPRSPQNLPGRLSRLERRPPLPDRRRPAASQSSHERYVHSSRRKGWGEPGQPPPLPPHLRYLGRNVPRTHYRSRRAGRPRPGPPRRALPPGPEASAACAGTASCSGPARRATGRRSPPPRRTAPATSASSPIAVAGYARRTRHHERDVLY